VLKCAERACARAAYGMRRSTAKFVYAIEPILAANRIVGCGELLNKMAPRLHRRPRGVFLVTAFVVFVFPSHADAYIDPGAGSIAYQAILVVALGAAVFIREWYGRARRFLFLSRVKREGAHRDR